MPRHTFTFQIDPKARKQIKEIAKAERRSAGSVVRLAIDADLDRRQQEAAAA